MCNAGFAERFAQHYQPIVRMDTCELTAYEALLRDAEGGNTAQLVDSMEQAGKIAQLDLWSLETVINKLSRRNGIPVVTVNISADSLCNHEFRLKVEKLLGARNDGNKIGFEITESRRISDLEAARRFVEMAKAYECTVGLDDLGTGHSSFNTAMQLELNFIKLSSWLTTRAIDSQKVKRIIKWSVSMADSMGMQVIGEHIESKGQYELLLDMGVHLGQWWLFAKAGASIEAKKNFRSKINAEMRCESYA